MLQIFEDAHWIDPTSLETIDQVINLIRCLPVLLIMTFRPEFSPPWVGRPHVTAIALSRLDQRDGAELIGSIVGNKPLPEDLVSEIVERTDGVPLFIEELTKAVLEAGSGGRDVASTLSSASSRDVPASLHASLMARFDRLGTGKEVAQISSALGREFSYELVSAVSPVLEADLRAALNQLTGRRGDPGENQLTEAGLLYDRGIPPEASYLFKHALVQDVAYGTLLRRTIRSRPVATA